MATLEEIKADKAQVQKQIKELLKDFSAKHGLQVNGIQVNTSEASHVGAYAKDFERISLYEYHVYLKIEL